MKKLIGTVLAASMLAGIGTPAVLADRSTIQPNEVVYGYQSIDFETGYEVGEVVMSNPLSGGQVSKDGKVYCSVEGGGTQDSVAVTIAGDENNKYLKIEDKETAGGIYANFKILNNNSALNNDMDYFVLKCSLKNGDSMSNAAGYLELFRNIRFNDEGQLSSGSSGYKLSKEYGWDDFMFVADRVNQKMYTAVNGEVTNIVCSDNAYADINSFLGSQLSTRGSNGVCTFYLDNLELYGVMSSTHEKAVCTLTPDSEDSSVVYASFTQPVKLTSSNVTVSGGASASVTAENGRFKIAVSGAAVSGNDVTVSGVTDIFGNTADTVTCRVSASDKQFRQMIDFETGYEIGEVVMSNPLSGGQVSKDGKVYCSVEGGGTQDSVAVTIAGDENNKYLKIEDKETAGGIYANFKILNNNSALNNDMDYFVIECSLKNGDSISNAAGYLELFRNIRFNDEGKLSSGGVDYYLPKAYGWDDFMFVADRKNQKMYTVVNGEVTDIVCSDNAYADINSFLGSQLSTRGSNGLCTFYLDDLELYGINTADTSLECKVTAPTESDAKAYVEFNHPAKLTASDITITNGATVSSVDYVNGKYEVVFSGLTANTSYDITVNSVTDIFGAASAAKTASFSVGRLQNTKTYLTTNKFTGKEDFEGYSADGIFESPDSSEVTTITNSLGINIKDIWTVTTGGKNNVRTALVKENGNTVLKLYVPGAAADNSTTMILQPKDDAVWTDTVKGKTYVYKARFKSGGENESSFYMMPFAGASFYFDDRNVTMGGQSADVIKVGEWNDMEYVIDYTGDTMVQYAVVNGTVVGSVTDNLNKIANGEPRWESAYAVNGAENCSLYFDDIEIYTTTGIQNNVLASVVTENVKCGEGVTVTFDSPVAQLGTANVEGIAAESVKALGNNQFRINFTEALSEGAHSITLKNVSDIYGNTLESETLSFNVVAGGKVEAITDIAKGESDMTVTINNTGTPTAAVVYIAAYNDGILSGIVKDNITVGMGERTYTLTGTAVGTVYKAFVWDANMTPLCTAFTK